MSQALLDIIRRRSYRRGNFTLASGETSEHYFNLKPTLLDHMGARLIGMGMSSLCERIRLYQDFPYGPPNYISGTAVGAVPLVTAIVIDGWKFRGTFVRKQAKGHGTRESIEGLADGESLEGHNVIVVEDVCTTGGSILEAVRALRDAGAVVTDAATIVERGGADLLLEEGISLHRLFTAQDIAEF
jgi:orotate phosphoribosyltransferase